MIVGRRCTSCGSRFYADAAANERDCQSCLGTHDPVPQALADAESLASIESFQANAPSQQVDPRVPVEPTRRRRKKAQKDEVSE